MAAVSDVRWAGAGVAGGRSPPPEAAPGPHPWAPVRGTGAPTARPVPASSRRCRAFPGHRFVGTSEKSHGVASRTAPTRGAERTAGRGGVAHFSLGSSEDPQRPPTVLRPPVLRVPPPPAPPPTICAPRAAPRVLRPAPAGSRRNAPLPGSLRPLRGAVTSQALRTGAAGPDRPLRVLERLEFSPVPFADLHVPAAGAPFSSPASRCPCPRLKCPATVGFQALPRTFPP